ncbi:26 kDa periplasmic immunogenic protein precursor [Clostridium puniceum]|uniref:26 kDa periplasmic immunogenic protein n=1 Tax=Clostridium puniceum TaxID=29367 RepID=A0A1S8SXY1_9CLOT|nr:SIMPL domain-containing protein [Clostridium puniceum]OOM70326.1 26 kDa periplasmic immunogenic protein precursor [Clostridium puniceum]
MFRLIDSDNYSLDDYTRNKCDNNRFKVFGKGVISVKPDAAEVVIGVTTENKQLEIAQEENANITQQVINSILRMGVLPKYIQTENYNIRSNYDYIDGKQVFRGYEVSNNLKILIRNIDLAGEIIDTAIKNGANNVIGISFIVSDQNTYYYEALRIAVTDAQNKASVMADKLKVKLDIIPIQINEQEKGMIAPLGAMTLKNVSVTTPIEIGENKITADIEALFKYSEQ